MKRSISFLTFSLVLLFSFFLLPAADSKTCTFDYAVHTDSGKKPFSYGMYTVISCSRLKGTERVPVNYASHKVHSINGVTLKEPFVIQLEFIDSYLVHGYDELVLSGYFTMKEMGTPSWPKDSPEAKYMGVSKIPFIFGDYFIATGIISPQDEKEKFEKKVVERRLKLYNVK